jgi:hypothetical protein
VRVFLKQNKTKYKKKVNIKPGMVKHGSKSSTQETEAINHELKVSLGYVER